MRGIAAVLLAACGSSSPTPAKVGIDPAALRFGDCTDVTSTTWVSGPQPTPIAHGHLDDAISSLDIPPPLGDEQPIATVREGESEDEIFGVYAPDEVLRANAKAAEHGPTMRFEGVSLRMRFSYDFYRRQIAAKRPQLVACYEKELATTPGLSARVDVKIDPADKVVKYEVTGIAGTFADCVRRAIGKLDRPIEHTRMDGVPFHFFVAPEPPSKPPPIARALFGEHSRYVFDDRYKVDANDPFVARRTSIAACLPQGYGAGIIDGTFGSGETASAATVHGVDPSVAACVAKAVVGTTRKVTDPPIMRCSFAWGTMPAADIPVITASPKSVAIAGKHLVDPSTLPKGLWIDQLYDLMHAQHAKAVEPTAPIVALHPPMVLKIDRATSMRIVYRVISSILVADEDFVFERGLAALGMPIVPVPLGTGQIHNPAQYRHGSASPNSDERAPSLSVLVGKDKVWFSISRVNEHTEVDFAHVADKMGETKHTAFFENRTFVEIAATPNATFGNFDDAVVAAEKAGFVDWQLMSPDQLTNRPEVPVP